MQDATIRYNGREHTIPARELMSVICGIEDIITLVEIQSCALQGTVKIAKIARAFAFVLNWVGVKVTDLEVYYEFLERRDDDAPGQNLERAGEILRQLIGLMTPPKHMENKLGADSGNGKAPASTSAGGSKSPTKPGLPGAIRRKTSGKQRHRNSGG